MQARTRGAWYRHEATYPHRVTFILVLALLIAWSSLAAMTVRSGRTICTSLTQARPPHTPLPFLHVRTHKHTRTLAQMHTIAHRTVVVFLGTAGTERWACISQRNADEAWPNIRASHHCVPLSGNSLAVFAGTARCALYTLPSSTLYSAECLRIRVCVFDA